MSCNDELLYFLAGGVVSIFFKILTAAASQPRGLGNGSPVA